PSGNVNFTLATVPSESVAVALTATTPETVEPFDGAVIATVGGRFEVVPPQVTPTSAHDCVIASSSACVNMSDVAASNTPWQPCVYVELLTQKLAFARYHALLARLTLSTVALPVGLPEPRRFAVRQNALFITPLAKCGSRPDVKFAALSIEIPSCVGLHM